MSVARTPFRIRWCGPCKANAGGREEGQIAAVVYSGAKEVDLVGESIGETSFFQYKLPGVHLTNDHISLESERGQVEYLLQVSFRGVTLRSRGSCSLLSILPSKRSILIRIYCSLCDWPVYLRRRAT